VKVKFYTNCLKKGYAEPLIEMTWNQIESFANFAFSKGHSASYAVESYQALFLKAHYPLEYLVATLNNGGGFYRRELYIHEARMHGAEISAPCVNGSEALCCLQGKCIFLGLTFVSELSEASIMMILKSRARDGPFTGLGDFLKRVPLSTEQMRLLIRVGAFNFTGKSKQKLLWGMHMQIQPEKAIPGQPELFEVKTKDWTLPVLDVSAYDNAFDEIELLGFPLSSPFGLLKDPLPSVLKVSELKSMLGSYVEIVGYLVTVKTTITSRGERMHFGTFVDLDGWWIDTVHFPPVVREFPFSGPGAYLIGGKVVVEYDFISIEVVKLKRLPVVLRE
jgi:DNA polymerase-3 subunit alpha